MVKKYAYTAETAWSPSTFITQIYNQYFAYISTLPSQEVKDTFHLSSGVNSFPMTKVWKDLLKLELDYNFLYRDYTNSGGIPFLTKLAAGTEKFFTTEGSIGIAQSTEKVYMTIGAAQAIAITFDFVSRHRSHASVLLLGFNYPIFEGLARQYGMKILECINEDRDTSCTLPAAETVARILTEHHPAILILTQPNNPSGEMYTQSDLELIFLAAKESQTLIVADLVGLLPISLDLWININKVIAQTQVQSQTVLIQSFSKTDSIPGLRIGYMMVPPEMDKYVSQYQSIHIMNPQTFPLIPLFISFLARCLFTGARMHWITEENQAHIRRLFSSFFVLNNPLAHPQIVEMLSHEKLKTHCDCYISEQMKNYDSIRGNYAYLLQTLKKYITRYTERKGGFNFLVEFSPFAKKDEEEVHNTLLHTLNIVVFPEACFRVYRRKKSNFWVRVTLASPEDDFQMAVDRLKKYFDQPC